MALDPAVLVKNDQDHLIHPLHHPSDHLEPMVYVRGRGAVITDIQGREYIDGLAGLWNVNVGHGREELAQAAAEQMASSRTSPPTPARRTSPRWSWPSKLISLAYPNMQAVFFTSGGAESNESAFKTARFYWKAKGKPDKVKMIARTLAYHGVTLQAMSATGMSPYWKMFEPRVPNFLHIPTCYPYRQDGAKPGETAGQTAARLLEEAILREGPDTVAAFIAEPIHGGGGVLYPDRRLLPAGAPGLRPPRRALHRRRGDHRLLPHRHAGSPSSTGTCSRTSCRSPRACPRAISRSAASWSRRRSRRRWTR